MNERARLAALIEGLSEALPEQVTGLLEHPRFAVGRAALTRLGEPGHRERAVASLAPDEAAWIEEELVCRWERIGPVTSAPIVQITGPDEEGLLGLRVDGLEAPVRVRWEGAELQPDGRARPISAQVEALVDGRWRGSRRLCTARWDAANTGESARDQA